MKNWINRNVYVAILMVWFSVLAMGAVYDLVVDSNGMCSRAVNFIANVKASHGLYVNQSAVWNYTDNTPWTFTDATKQALAIPSAAGNVAKLNISGQVYDGGALTVGTPAIVTITDATYNITSADSGKILTNVGSTVDTTWTLAAALPNTFQVQCVNEVGGISGGTTTIDGDYTIKTFTSSGTFVTAVAITAETIIVGGGGSGGRGSAANGGSGGGGGGGVQYDADMSIPAGIYTVTVGNGGTAPGSASNGATGVNSVFNSITANGGVGGYGNAAVSAGGASGAPQSKAGGSVSGDQGGGGGGAGAVGGNGGGSVGGVGGAGLEYMSAFFGAGGGGGGYTGGGGGSSIGGHGNNGAGTGDTSGNVNTGSGGGGGYGASTCGSGGSGIVKIKYLTSSVTASTITLTPASGEQLPDTSSINRLLKSSFKNDFKAFRKTNTGLISTGVVGTWVDTAP